MYGIYLTIKPQIPLLKCYCGKQYKNMTLMGYYLIAGVMFIVGYMVSKRLKSKFKEYSQIGLSNGMSGKEIAEKMLADNGIPDVRVLSTPEHLSDHYNPQDKTINLSFDVYEGRSVSAAAVAAHECGHAVNFVPALNSTFLKHFGDKAGLEDKCDRKVKYGSCTFKVPSNSP